MSNTSLLRFGIIGIGNIGSAHAKHLYEGLVPEAVLAAICDSDPHKREAAERITPGVPFFANHEELFSSGLIDAVIIATPHYFHPPIAIDAFRAGLHVLTEKPAGVDTADVVKMNLAAKESGKRFGIMFNQRTNPLFAEAKRIVASGELGELRRSVWIITNWYRKQAYYDSGAWRGSWSGEGGGVLINQAPHNLDLWQWICGMPIRLRADCAVAKYHDVEVEDDATLFAEYQNGATGVFITSTGEYPGTNRLEIAGSKGKLVLEKGVLQVHLAEQDERTYRLTPTEVKNPVQVTEIADSPRNGHVEILKNFTSAILHNTPLLAPGEDGICELTLSNAAYLSAWTGETVSIPFDRSRFTAELMKRKQASRERSALRTESHEGSYLSRWNTNW